LSSFLGIHFSASSQVFVLPDSPRATFAGFSPSKRSCAAFNRARLLPETLASILAQPYGGRLEVLVIDDGSTDNTPEIAAKFAQESGAGGRLRVIRQENAGAAAARNRGLRESTTDLTPFAIPTTPGRRITSKKKRAFFKNIPMLVCFLALFAIRGWKVANLAARTARTVEVHSGFVIPRFSSAFHRPSRRCFRSVCPGIGGMTQPLPTEDYDFCLRWRGGVRRCISTASVAFTAATNRLHAATPDVLEGVSIRCQRPGGDREFAAGGSCRSAGGRTISSARRAPRYAQLRARLSSFHLRLARSNRRRAICRPHGREARSALHLLPANRASDSLWKLFAFRSEPPKF
jgi:hypothetical protein